MLASVNCDHLAGDGRRIEEKSKRGRDIGGVCATPEDGCRALPGEVIG